MNRFLFITVVLYIVWRVLHAYGRRIARQRKGAEEFSRFSARSRERREGQAEAVAIGGDLAECVVCGTLVPHDRSLAGADGGRFCSEDCRDRRSTIHADEARGPR